MLKGVFLIFLFQLAGEVTQKFFELSVPGPVIGLLLLLVSLLLTRSMTAPLKVNLETSLATASGQLLAHLPLLFVPIGVGVVMHVSFLENSLLKVLATIFIGTVVTVGFTALVVEKLQDRDAANDG
ncbi:MAG: CidA/LrgA family protein [Gammaproteobacteria bacterium]|nr:CidA/LrgA family protein [Gammaproteobacteria bacterium]MDH3447748.1 CidA/LrgA family protein [Gammaproteobacteria bacterium]